VNGLGAVLCASSLLLAAGCGSSSSSSTRTSSPATSVSSSAAPATSATSSAAPIATSSASASAAPPGGYPPAFQSAFLAACKAHAGANGSKCQCALTKIEQTIPLQKLLTEATALQKGQGITGQLEQAVLACA
jgi:hypothetical protein